MVPRHRATSDDNAAPPDAKIEERALWRCARCESGLVQPEGWRELAGGDLLLHLRCPECASRTTGGFSGEAVAAYDDELVRGRAVLLAAYEELVRQNMEEAAERFVVALALDLIGPDDFLSSRVAG
jgi:DNA-directed RNA polymerase subunit RPC12/RpoP